jgi:hypothetical protein
MGASWTGALEDASDADETISDDEEATDPRLEKTEDAWAAEPDEIGKAALEIDDVLSCGEDDAASALVEREEDDPKTELMDDKASLEAEGEEDGK